MKRKNKVALGLVGLATAGVAAGAIGGVVAANQTSSVINQVENNVSTDNNTNNNVTNEVVDNGNTNIPSKDESNTSNTGSSSSNESNTTVDFSEAFSAKLTRMVSRSSDENKYVLTVNQNVKKEGAIFIIDEKGEMQQQMEVSPGQLIKVGVVFNEGYENYTVRELKVYGANPNYTVPTKQVTGPANQFTFKLPTMAEQKSMSGENMFYGDGNSEINIIPSFIVGSIGQDTNWQHGAFFETINGYVFSMDKDMKWTELVNHIVKGQFVNDDITDPINIFVYLNGHTLTVDTSMANMSRLPLSKSGWALHFYNNSTDSATADGKYGKIVPDKDVNAFHDDFDYAGQIDVDGIIALGRSVEYNMITWNKGMKFLAIDNHQWDNSASRNNPNESK